MHGITHSVNAYGWVLKKKENLTFSDCCSSAFFFRALSKLLLQVLLWSKGSTLLSTWKIGEWRCKSIFLSQFGPDILRSEVISPLQNGQQRWISSQLECLSTVWKSIGYPDSKENSLAKKFLCMYRLQCLYPEIKRTVTSVQNLSCLWLNTLAKRWW